METTQTNPAKTFLHWGSIGDVWASLPGVREIVRKTGKKAIYYLGINQQGNYYKGAVHPTLNEFGQQVLLNEAMANMMIPFLKAQDFIEDACIFEWQKVDCDLSAIRDTFTNLPYGHIARWYFYVYPDMACNLGETYLTAPTTFTDFAKGKIIINRTERYITQFVDAESMINYSFLKAYESELVFAGTESEHQKFCEQFNLNIPRLQIENFLELAQAMKQCRFFIGNQSQAFQIAEGLKIPRMVELCNFAPNVIPTGDNAYDFYVNAALKYYFDVLYKL